MGGFLLVLFWIWHRIRHVMWWINTRILFRIPGVARAQFWWEDHVTDPRWQRAPNHKKFVRCLLEHPYIDGCFCKRNGNRDHMVHSSSSGMMWIELLRSNEPPCRDWYELHDPKTLALMDSLAAEHP